MASTQTLLLGRYDQELRASLEKLNTERYVQRLWDKDASLWTSDAAAQSHIRNRLGWLTIPRVMARETAALRAFAQEMRGAGFTRSLLLGMGGSGLFSEVCRHTFGIAPGSIDLTVLDTTDPTAIRTQQTRGSLKELFVIVSSKSGATSEVAALSAYFYDAFKTSGGDPGAHCIAITDAGTSLEAQAKRLAYRRAFVHGAGSGADVGGRFSALTYFGLVPASLMGVEIDTLLARAVEMLDRCQPATPLQDNPAAMLGAALGALYRLGKDKMTLLCPPALESIGIWVEQLIAESTGKSGKGIAPFFGERLREPSTYPSDRVFIELQLASQLDAGLDRRVRALAEAGHPVIRIHWQDRYDLGGDVIRWAIATAITASLMDINPFDEPNVQESKDRTNQLLAQYTKDRRFPEETPLFSDGQLSVYGTATSGRPSSLHQCLSEWVQRVRPSDYTAVLSFLPRTPPLDDAVHALRHKLAATLGSATMLGFGPRYLHSTGQLYKGGPDAALFLELTAEEAQDLAIPGAAYTFGVLKFAQALGDYQAMQDCGRRVLRVHLRGDLERGLKQLSSAIDEATAPLSRR